MPTNPNGFDAVVDSHEDRLQRVESTVQDTAVQVAEINVKQTYLSDEMSKHRTESAQTMKDGFSRIEASIERLVGKVADHDDRLAPVEFHVKVTQKKNAARTALLKKSAIGALLAAGGVFATKGGEWLWMLLSR